MPTSFVVIPPHPTAAGAVDPVLLQQLVDDAVTNELASNTDVMRKSDGYDPGNDGAVDMVDEVFHTFNILAPGQTVFTLPRAAKQPLLAEVVMEDLTYRYGATTFTIAVDGLTLTWHNAIVLQPSFSFTIKYR